jgi:hypothetical protein
MERDAPDLHEWIQQMGLSEQENNITKEEGFAGQE